MNSVAGGVGLVIFDCDGVLVDSEPIFNRAHAEILAESGFPIAAEMLIERFCGIADGDMRAAIERDWNRRLPADYLTRVTALADRLCEHSLGAIAGVADTLDSLELPRCVASSSAPERVRKSLALTGLLDRLEPHIFSALMVARGKPAPDLFLHAAREMRADPARCLVVEDSIAGVEAGVAAGMSVIGFYGGGHCPSDHGDVLRRHGAVRAISDIRQLLPGIAALGRGR